MRLNQRNIRTFLVAVLILYPIFLSVRIFPGVNQNIVDRIMAVVNRDVITLYDVRIVRALGLYRNEMNDIVDDPLRFYLERIIDQKLVIQMTREDIVINDVDLDDELMELTGFDEWNKLTDSLFEFGLELGEIKEYLQERLLFKRIIARKFNRAVIVSLDEIENHYQEVYLPAEVGEEREPRSMLEILDEIETAIKEAKIKKQVLEWIRNLRQEAEVKIVF